MIVELAVLAIIVQAETLGYDPGVGVRGEVALQAHPRADLCGGRRGISGAIGVER